MIKIKLALTLIFLSSACVAQIHFSEKDKIELKNEVIKDYELTFILDSVGKKVLSECTVQLIEEHFTKYGRPSVDTLNAWYSKSRLNCIGRYKSQLNNCYTRWSAFPSMNEGTVRLFESFVPVLKKVRDEDKQLVISKILEVFRENYPEGFPFNVPPNKLNSMLNQLQLRIAKIPRLKKYI